MDTAKKLYLADISRYGDACPREMKRFHYYFRKAQNATNPLLKLYYRWVFSRLKKKNISRSMPGQRLVGAFIWGIPTASPSTRRSGWAAISTCIRV